jgi:hypothetical protein
LDSNQRFCQAANSFAKNLRARKEPLHFRFVEKLNLVNVTLAEPSGRARHEPPNSKVPEQLELDVGRKVMYEGGKIVGLHGEPTVWRLYKVPLPDPGYLAGELPLILRIIKVLDYGICIHNVERLIAKRQFHPICNDLRQPFRSDRALYIQDRHAGAIS